MEHKLATVNLPCSAAQLEAILLHVSHQGHWHDAQVRMDSDGKLAIFHPKEET